MGLGCRVPEDHPLNNSPSTRPRLATHALDLNVICDICGRSRPAFNHSKCSRIRQQRKSAEWESYMANVKAKKALQKSGLARRPSV